MRFCQSHSRPLLLPAPLRSRKLPWTPSSWCVGSGLLVRATSPLGHRSLGTPPVAPTILCGAQFVRDFYLDCVRCPASRALCLGAACSVRTSIRGAVATDVAGAGDARGCRRRSRCWSYVRSRVITSAQMRREQCLRTKPAFYRPLALSATLNYRLQTVTIVCDYQLEPLICRIVVYEIRPPTPAARLPTCPPNLSSSLLFRVGLPNVWLPSVRMARQLDVSVRNSKDRTDFLIEADVLLGFQDVQCPLWTRWSSFHSKNLNSYLFNFIWLLKIDFEQKRELRR